MAPERRGRDPELNKHRPARSCPARHFLPRTHLPPDRQPLPGEPFLEMRCAFSLHPRKRQTGVPLPPPNGRSLRFVLYFRTPLLVFPLRVLCLFSSLGTVFNLSKSLGWHSSAAHTFAIVAR